MSKRRYISRLLDKLAPRRGLVLLVMAICVGAGTGLAAVIFIKLISFIQTFSYTRPDTVLSLGRLWLIIIPVAGALVSGPVIAFFAQEAKGHGVPEVMQALMLHGGRIRPRVAIAKIFASALCIGTGGSAGREGPIVQVGSTLGSTLGQWFHLSDGRIKNLVACGAAAGIAATFNAPIAGVVFAIEVLMSELHVTVFGNVVISAVAASIVSQAFLGDRPAFLVPTYIMHSPWEIMLYAALGFFAALLGVFFIRMLDVFETLFEKMNIPQSIKPAIGALLLGLLAFSYPYLSESLSLSAEDMRMGMPLAENLPHVYGSGFTFLADVLQGNAPFLLLVLLIFLKPLATSLTLGSGNSGGVFAPSLFTGAMLGGAFGYAAQALFPHITGEIGAYALVGMAAVFSATARAPLTSMLIVFEMSNDYHLILPLMAACMVASSVAQRLHTDSIYTLKLTRKGIHFDQGRDQDIMQSVQVEEVMNKAPVTIHKDQSTADLFAAFQETHLQGFPVMANDEDIFGFVSIHDVERTIHALEENPKKEKTSLKDIKVCDVATHDPVTVFPDEPIWSAICKMAPRDLARLPVVARNAEQKLVGLISRSDILRAYDIGLMKKQQGQYIQDSMTLRKVTNIEFFEATAPEGSIFGKKKLSRLGMPTGANVVSIERDNTFLIPNGKTVIKPGDKLTILCKKKKVPELQQIFKCPEE